MALKKKNQNIIRCEKRIYNLEEVNEMKASYKKKQTRNLYQGVKRKKRRLSAKNNIFKNTKRELE